MPYNSIIKKVDYAEIPEHFCQEFLETTGINIAGIRWAIYDKGQIEDDKGNIIYKLSSDKNIMRLWNIPGRENPILIEMPSDKINDWDFDIWHTLIMPELTNKIRNSALY